jgi:hypothetical protein
MEPLDTDLDYMQPPARPASTPASRSRALLVFPVLGLLLALTFVLAAVLQLNLSELVDSLMGLMMLFFVIMVVLLFWALAPRGEHS